jgi:hypothetical protein
MYDLERLSEEHRGLVEAGESLCVDRYDESLDLAEDPDTEPEALWYLGLCDEMEVVRMGVAANESTPPELLELMTRDPSGEVRGEVEDNPNCPPAALQFLADLEAACDPETPKEHLLRWAKAPEDLLRYHVASNPGIDESLMELLTELLTVEGLSGPIARGLVHNPNTPVNVLTQLAESEAFDSMNGNSVAAAVAVHPNSSAEVLAKLSNCNLPGVQEALTSRTGR